MKFKNLSAYRYILYKSPSEDFLIVPVEEIIEDARRGIRYSFYSSVVGDKVYLIEKDMWKFLELHNLRLEDLPIRYGDFATWKYPPVTNLYKERRIAKIRNKTEEILSLADKIRKDLKEINEKSYQFLEILEKYHWGRHASETRFEGVEFDIKLWVINLPDEVYEKMSDRDIDEIFWQVVNFELKNFISYLSSKYPWAKRIATAGRNNGWLVVELNVLSLDEIEDIIYISEKYLENLDKDIESIIESKLEDSELWRDKISSYEEFIEEAKRDLKRMKSVLKDIEKIDREVKERKRALVYELESFEFWQQFLE